MKRFFLFCLAVSVCISLTACSGTKKAFEVSKSAYDSIDIAYDITEQFGSDLYEAWRIGIFEEDELLSDGAHYLSQQLNLSEEDIKKGIGYIYATSIVGENWDTVAEEDKTKYYNRDSVLFKMKEDELFSTCVWVVIYSYKLNGKVDEVQTALNTAKEQMKELSDKYSDYEHYPNLKGYYTTTSSFFDFCQNPTGSFEQMKNTINDYKNEARDYISDLDYIFEE
ncbi:MAG: hypothetical protein MR705_00205 [Flintibacter sp.]|uniref:hypothetical protein n=1 Tax=Flintibacter TaxID=1918454 RepID=UPI001F218D31|nr:MULTISPECIES: hypothetical protein [Eubacteriales]MCF2676676.1 hypothetical protein [Pseudoflavonifractor phocaeensis]MCI6148862.1 hypothetical protein [Flintibacter sp.]